METTLNTEKNKKHISYLTVLVLVLLILCVGIFSASLGVQAYENALEEKEAAYVAAIAKTAKEVDIPKALRTSTAAKVSKQEKIPAYSLSQVETLDLRKSSGITASDLKLVTSAGLVGLEDEFIAAEKKYGVNCVFLMSIASLESAKGTQMFRPNNMFGYGKSGFSSKGEGIQVVASGLSSRYLKPGASLYGGSPTLKGVNKRYAANPQWHAKVGKYMTQYYSVISARRSAALDKLN